jgi:hypothetical protein
VVIQIHENAPLVVHQSSQHAKKKVLMHTFIWIELIFECSNIGLVVRLLDYFFCLQEYDEEISIT